MAVASLIQRGFGKVDVKLIGIDAPGQGKIAGKPKPKIGNQFS